MMASIASTSGSAAAPAPPRAPARCRAKCAGAGRHGPRRRIGFAGSGRQHMDYISGLPSRSAGSGTPSSFRIVGDRSMMRGEAVAILRFEKSTPPLISVAVAQWSPLHLRLLFSTTVRLIAAERVLPAHAVAVVEADLQVGRVLQVLALVDVVALVDRAQRPLRPSSGSSSVTQLAPRSRPAAPCTPRPRRRCPAPRGRAG